MSRWRKKPVVVDAFHWTGDMNQIEDPMWIVGPIRDGSVWFGKDSLGNVVMLIATLEGTMVANQGDYIIRGLKGELYPCKPDIFEESYELVDVSPNGDM